MIVKYNKDFNNKLEEKLQSVVSNVYVFGIHWCSSIKSIGINRTLELNSNYIKNKVIIKISLFKL